MNLRRNTFYFPAKCAILLIFAVCINAQTAAELTEAVNLERQATESYNRKDFAKFLELTKQAGDLRPNHPRLLYNLADAYALNGKTDDALKILARMARMDLFFDFGKDEDFKSLFDLPEFKKLQAEFALNRKAVNRSNRAFTIPQKTLIAEGIAYDAAAQRFFVSGIHLRKIVTIDKNGAVSDFSSASDGLWSVLGMKVDVKRRILWATTTAFPQMENFQKEDDGKSGVFKYDLRTGKLLKKYLLSNETEKHALGDLTIGANGDVFASDSLSPYIYRISANKDEIETFIKSDLFSSLQGLTFSPDGKYLFAADYSKGVFRIDMNNKKIVQITPDADTNPIGIDGLYFHRGNLIVTQNAFAPNRIARLTLNKDLSRITKSETLEANHADFNEPSLGVIVGDEFYYIANGQISLADEKGNLAEDKLKEPVILRLKL